MIFIVLEIGEGNFEDSSFEGIVGVLETSGSVYECFSDTEGVSRCLLLVMSCLLSGCEC